MNDLNKEKLPLLTLSNSEELLAYLYPKNNSNRSESYDNEGFESYESIFRNAQKQIENAETEHELYELEKKYSDILYIDSDGNIEPYVLGSTYRRLCNRDRMYVVGENVIKVLNRGTIITTDISNISNLYNINSVEQVPSSFKYKIYNEVTKKSSDINGRIEGHSSTCNGVAENSVFIYAQYFKNNSGCKNDRSVRIDAELIRTYGGGIFWSIDLDFSIVGKKRNGLCIWSKYTTRMTHTEIDIEFTWTSETYPYANNPETFNLWAWSAEMVSEINYIENYAAGLFGMEPVLNFVSASGSAQTRGTSPYWASLNCS